MILGQNCSTIYHSTIDNSKKSINFVISSRMKISNAPPQGYVPRGFFMKRAIFFIDGFNLYHSIRSIQDATGQNLKWLNIKALCYSYLPTLGSDVVINSINYFSAIPNYLSMSDPDKILRHKLYIKCLQDTGINVILGRFKEKSVYCNKCKSYLTKHEEKETDVSIAIKIIETFITNQCDIAIIVTGDTDLTPVIRSVKQYFSLKEVLFLFPYDRENKEIAKLLPRSFSIKKKSYVKYQFPDPFILSDRTSINRPLNWR